MTSKCSIEFRDVSFSYVADSPVIKDISFTCPGGQTLALVGATGKISIESPAYQGNADGQLWHVLTRSWPSHILC